MINVILVYYSYNVQCHLIIQIKQLLLIKTINTSIFNIVQLMHGLFGRPMFLVQLIMN